MNKHFQLAVLFILAAAIRAEEAPTATISVTPDGKIESQRFEGEASLFLHSPRSVWLSLAPSHLEPSTLTLVVEGMDPGDYFLTVSGQPPVLTQAAELTRGIPVSLPAVVGPAATGLLESVSLWEGRLDRVAQVVEDHGYRFQDIPSDYRQRMQRIRDLGQGLEEAALSRAVAIRVTPKDAGPSALAPLSTLDPEELEKRGEELSRLRKELASGAGSLDNPLRSDLLEAMLPIEVGEFGGQAVSLANAGQSGQGSLSFEVTNPQGNPEAEIEVTLPVPQGWRIEGSTLEELSLAPGQSAVVSRDYAVVADRGSPRVAFPMGLSIRMEGQRYKSEAGLGFGHDFIRAWSLIGPFENLQNTAVDIQYPPEVEFEKDKTYSGLGERPVSWQQVEAGANGYLDLKELLDPDTNCAAYAAVFVHSPESQNILCAAGSNDGMKVFVNGETVFAFPGERGAQPEQDRFPARLVKGWNLLLVKVLNTGGEWGLYFEIRDEAGGTPAGMKLSPLPPD
jgi:hypothetical protein